MTVNTDFDQSLDLTVSPDRLNLSSNPDWMFTADLFFDHVSQIVRLELDLISC